MRSSSAGFAAALGAALLFWGPILFHDGVRAFHPLKLSVSSVMRTQAALAFAVCAGLILLLAMASSLAAHRARRHFSSEAYEPAPMLPEFTAVVVGSALIIHRPLLPSLPATAVLLTGILGAVLAVSLPIAVRRNPGRRVVLITTATGGLLLWLLGIVLHLDWREGHATALLLFLASAGVIAFFFTVMTPARYAGQRRVLIALALLLGLGGPLVVYLSLVPRTASGITGGGYKPSASSQAEEKRDLPPGGVEASPNVLIFMVDTLRADHMTPWGYPLDTTPHLQRLLGERAASIFTNAWAGAATTIPSVKSLFTGQLPSHWGYDEWGYAPPPDGVWTMAEAFRRSGYRTAAFSANGALSRTGFEQGFEEYLALGAFDKTFLRSFLLYGLLFGERYYHAMTRSEQWRMHKVHGETALSLARPFLENRDKRPFFLYLHLVEPHWPYHERGYGLVPEDFGDLDDPLLAANLLQLPLGIPENRRFRETPHLRELVGRYDEEIRFADDLFGRIMTYLEERDILDSTLVILLGDHGEEFFEHDGFSHGHAIFEEQVHVPMVMFYPDLGTFSDLPSVVGSPASLVDLLPTLTDYLDLTGPPAELHGQSLRTVLEGETRIRPIITEAYPGIVFQAGYREGNLVVRLGYSFRVSPQESDLFAVYDLEEDPGQIEPLPGTDPRVGPLIQRARIALQEPWSRWAAAGRDVPKPSWKTGMDEDEATERLRSLGYIE